MSTEEVKKPAAKAPAKKPAARKTAAKKPAAKAPAAKKPVAKAPAKKAPAARKPAAKKTAPKAVVPKVEEALANTLLGDMAPEPNAPEVKAAEKAAAKTAEPLKIVVEEPKASKETFIRTQVLDKKAPAQKDIQVVRAPARQVKTASDQLRDAKSGMRRGAKTPEMTKKIVKCFCGNEVSVDRNAATFFCPACETSQLITNDPSNGIDFWGENAANPDVRADFAAGNVPATRRTR